MKAYHWRGPVENGSHEFGKGFFVALGKNLSGLNLSGSSQ